GVVNSGDRGGGELAVAAEQQDPASARLRADRVARDRAHHGVTGRVGETGGREDQGDERDRGRRRGQPPPAHAPWLGSRCVKRGGEALLMSRSSSSETSCTVDRTASSATPDRVSCSIR